MATSIPSSMGSLLDSGHVAQLGAARVQAQPSSYTDLASLQNIKGEANKDVALQKVAKQFESMFVSMMFKGMRQSNAVFEEGNPEHSNAEKTYRDMYDQQMSLNISEGRGLGIANIVYKQLKGMHKAEHVAADLDHSAMYKSNTFSPSLQAQFSPINPPPPTQITLLKKAITSAPLQSQVAQPKNKNANDAVKNTTLFTAQTPAEFTRALLPIAQKAAAIVGLDPIMMVAQAALETGWGKHMVKNASGENSNNLFNIKADSRWGGDSVHTKTLEYKGGIAVKESAKFRRYDSITESIHDFIDFIQTNPRYDQAIKNAENPEAFIDELHQAGYATDPLYAEKVKAVYQHVHTVLTAD